MFRSNQLGAVDNRKIEVIVLQFGLVILYADTGYRLYRHAVQVVVQVLDEQIGGLIEFLPRHAKNEHSFPRPRGLERWLIIGPPAGTGHHQAGSQIKEADHKRGPEDRKDGIFAGQDHKGCIRNVL